MSTSEEKEKPKVRRTEVGSSQHPGGHSFLVGLDHVIYHRLPLMQFTGRSQYQTYRDPTCGAGRRIPYSKGMPHDTVRPFQYIIAFSDTVQWSQLIPGVS